MKRGMVTHSVVGWLFWILLLVLLAGITYYLLNRLTS